MRTKVRKNFPRESLQTRHGAVGVSQRVSISRRAPTAFTTISNNKARTPSYLLRALAQLASALLRLPSIPLGEGVLLICSDLHPPDT